jgi:transcriptional regulator with XRE-family HTH domain
MEGVMKIGAIMKRARERAGLTLRELAAKVGSSAATLSLIENDNMVHPLSPPELVRISDQVLDRLMLVEYCDSCPVRMRIVIHKFPPLNNTLPGAQIAIMKVVRKMAEASDALQPMLDKLLNAGFRADPDFREYRNRAFLKILDMERGLEILKRESMAQGLITMDELQMLRDIQQRQCEEKGHHVPDRSEG